jgi:hypothetical protein
VVGVDESFIAIDETDELSRRPLGRALEQAAHDLEALVLAPPRPIPGPPGYAWAPAPVRPRAVRQPAAPPPPAWWERLPLPGWVTVGSVLGLGLLVAIWGVYRPGAAPAASAPAIFEIVSTPPGATVAIDGQEQPGRTPLVVASSAVDRATLLHITRPGYLTASHRLEDLDRVRERFVVVLDPAPGTIRVQGTPAGARVELDGNTPAPLPASLERVDTTRQHVVTVTAPGHARLRQVIEPTDDWLPVKDGRLLTLAVALAPGADRPAVAARRETSPVAEARAPAPAEARAPAPAVAKAPARVAAKAPARVAAKAPARVAAKAPARVAAKAPARVAAKTPAPVVARAAAPVVHADVRPTEGARQLPRARAVCSESRSCTEADAPPPPGTAGLKRPKWASH